MFVPVFYYYYYYYYYYALDDTQSNLCAFFMKVFYFRSKYLPLRYSSELQLFIKFRVFKAVLTANSLQILGDSWTDTQENVEALGLVAVAL